MGTSLVSQLGDSGQPGHNDLAALARIIEAGVPARSRWALNAAAEAAITEGIGGILVVQIPPKGKDLVDITFTIGMVEVVSRWAG